MSYKDVLFNLCTLNILLSCLFYLLSCCGGTSDIAQRPGTSVFSELTGKSWS